MTPWQDRLRPIPGLDLRLDQIHGRARQRATILGLLLARSQLGPTPGQDRLDPPQESILGQLDLELPPHSILGTPTLLSQAESTHGTDLQFPLEIGDPILLSAQALSDLPLASTTMTS